MTVTIVHVWVKPEKINAFIEATRKNHVKSVEEEGNLRFDILQDSNNPSKFSLYEAYISEEAALAHKDTQHYLEWKETVKDWMAKPREGIKHNILYPENF